MRGRHISQSFIDELLARVDIVSVIEPHVPLKKAGNNYKGLCPFHQEKTPSFSVSATKQFYHCFGCGANGNAIHFLMEYERLTFVEAIETLASMAGLEVVYERGDTGSTTPSTSPSEAENLFVILEKSAQFFEQQLKTKEGQKAIEYLKSRGLTGGVAKRFQIGYVPKGWENLLRFLGHDQKALLLTAGMLIKNEEGRCYDRFRDRIMFPIKDRRGRIIGFGGRVLSNEEQPKYLNSPETPVFHKGEELYGLYEALQAKRKLDRLMIVEGYMDVIALAQHGIDYAVATLGTATSAEHIIRLFRLTKEVVFCFDGDRAGRNAAWHAVEILLSLLRDEWEIRFLFLPEGDDPDSYVRAQGKNHFEENIKKAQSLSEFFFHQLKVDIDLSRTDGKAQLSKKAMAYINKMPNCLRRDFFLDQLSKQVSLDQARLEHYLEASPEKITPDKKQGTTPMRQVMAILLQFPKIGLTLDSNAFPADQIAGASLLKALLKLITDKAGNISTAQLIEHWRDQKESAVLRKLAAMDLLISEEEALNTMLLNLKKIDIDHLNDRINQLMQQAQKTALLASDKALLQNLLKEKQKKELLLYSSED